MLARTKKSVGRLRSEIQKNKKKLLKIGHRVSCYSIARFFAQVWGGMGLCRKEGGVQDGKVVDCKGPIKARKG